MEIQEVSHTDPTGRDFLDEIHPNITRQKMMTFTSVFGRIPHSFLSGEGMDHNQSLSLTVVDNNMDPTFLATAAQEDQSGTSSFRVVPPEGQVKMSLMGNEETQSIHWQWACSESIRYQNSLPQGPLTPKNTIQVLLQNM